MSCGVACRWRGSDLEWLWLWCRLAAAAQIPPLAWEISYAPGVALKRRIVYKCQLPNIFKWKLLDNIVQFIQCSVSWDNSINTDEFALVTGCIITVLFFLEGTQVGRSVTSNLKYHEPLSFLFLFFASPTGCRSSQHRDGTLATVVTQTTAGRTWDP